MAGIATSIKLTDMMSPALKKIIQNMNKAQEEFEQFQKLAGNSFNTSRSDAMNKSLNNIKKQMDDLNDQMNKFDNETQKAQSSVGGLGDSFSGLAGAIGGALSAKAIGDGIKSALESADTQNAMEAQLKATMQNMGNADQYDTLIKKAQDIQSKGIYGDEAMIGAAAEFSTYMQDTDAIQLMMDTLTDYAAGMTGGGAINTEEMVNFATNLGKITTGAYDAMTKKGFEFSDAQKAIMKGTATEAQLVEELGEDYRQYSDDMAKAKVINSIISESWNGMYKTMSNTPEASIIKFQNAWGDVQEEIGNKLYPHIEKLFEKLQENLPTIEDMLGKAVSFVGDVIDKLSGLFDWISENQEAVEGFITNLITVGTVFATVIGAIQMASTAMKAFSNPATVYGLILAFGALAVATLNAGSASEETQQTVLDGWSSALSTLTKVGTIIVSTFQMLIGGLVGLIGTANNNIGAFFTEIQASLIQFVSDALSNMQPLVDLIEWITGTNVVYELTGKATELWTKADEMRADDSIWDWFNEGGERLADTLLGKYDQDFNDIGKQTANEVLNPLGVYGMSEEDLAKLKEEMEQGQNNDDSPNAGFDWDEWLENAKKTSKNTGKTAKALEVTNEDIKYLREIADRDVINRFTTASIKVDMTNNNSINSDMDIDGVIGALETRIYESMSSAAEGVYV